MAAKKKPIVYSSSRNLEKVQNDNLNKESNIGRMRHAQYLSAMMNSTITTKFEEIRQPFFVSDNH